MWVSEYVHDTGWGCLVCLWSAGQEYGKARMVKLESRVDFGISKPRMYIPQ
jgi:hypothetical protein